MNKAIPRANRPPRERASEGLMAVAAEVEVDLAALEVEDAEELVPVPELLEVEPEAVEPEVPLETEVPGRLTVALAARAWKLASVRVALAVGLCHS
jgi:hypothetical protein